MNNNHEHSNSNLEKAAFSQTGSSQPSLMHEQNDEIIDLRQYFNVLMKFKWRIMLFSVLVTALTVLVVLTIPAEYTARATLLIESKQAKAVSIEEVYGLDTEAKEYYLTQIEILKSERIAEQVIERLALTKHPEFDPTIEKKPRFGVKLDIFELVPALKAFKRPEQQESVEAFTYRVNRLVLAQFQANLSISPVRKTQLVHISYTSKDPDLAALIANEVGNVFIESHLEAKLEAANKASGWLNTRVGDLHKALKASEQKLQSFLQQEGLVDVQGVESLASQELAELTSQVNRARDRRVAAETLYSVATTKEASITALSAVPEISNHPTIRDVKLAETQAERRVSELSKRYGPKHPKLRAAVAELNSVQTTLEQELKQLLNGISSELTAARKAERTLSQELESRKSEFQSLTVKNAKYDELKRDVQTNRQLYDLFLNRQKETTASSDFDSTIARFTDSAMPPLFPSKPNRKLMVILAFVASFGFACVLAFVTESLNDTFHNEKQVEKELGLNLLGAVPVIKGRKKLNARSYFDQKHRQLTESVRTIRTGYLLANSNKGHKTVMVTSSVPEEGKTTSSINLAMSLSQMEKTLLIDCDLRKPAVASRFALSGSMPGVSNVITGSHSLDDCIIHDEETGLNILPAGLSPSNPLELLSSQGFRDLLALLTSQYERIVVDTPPCLAVSDAFVIAQLVDSCVVVVNSSNTRTGTVKNVVSKLAQKGARLDGVVLNKLNIKKAVKYGGYYQYQSYYGTAEANS